MFRVTKDPSSGSDNLYLIEITYNGSIVLIMCVVGVWRHILDLWSVCTLCWSESHSVGLLCNIDFNICNCYN